MVPALRNMRIVAIPLTRPRVQPPVGAQLNRLTYYQFQISAKRKQKLQSPAENGSGADGNNGKEKKGWLPEEGVANWVMNKASETWAGFGKAEGGWKVGLWLFYVFMR